MSIMSRMKKVQVFNPCSEYDAYGRPLQNSGEFEDAPCLEVDMSISIKSQDASPGHQYNGSNQERYTEITHVGITTSRELKKGQKVLSEDKELIVHLEPLMQSRFTQVYLKEASEDG